MQAHQFDLKYPCCST